MKNVVCLFVLMLWSLFSYAQIIQFTDTNFKNTLVNINCVDITGDGFGDNDADTNNDGEIDINEAEQVQVLNLSFRSINNLEGISFFKNLVKLNCSNNKLSSLILSNFLQLSDLDCSWSQLSSLSLSQLPLLNKIKCNQNKFPSLTLFNLPSLQIIECNSGSLISLTLNNLPSLNNLNCSYNQITSLSLEQLPNLIYLDCKYNKLTSLTFGSLSQMIEIDCEYNKISSLSIPEAPVLNAIRCSSNNLASLSLSNLPKLEAIVCMSNILTNLSLSNLPELKILTCKSNNLQELELNDFPKLEGLYCDKNQLITLTLQNLPNLNQIYCSNNLISTLSLNELNKLIWLTADNNPLESLFLKIGVEFNFIFLSPNIKYICTDEINLPSFKIKYPNAEINSYCSFSPGGKYYSIKGKTKIDINNNGCEESDVNCSNLKYKIKHNSTTSNHLTNINGSYNLLLAEGTYYLKPLIENIESYKITPDSITVTFPSTSDTIIQDFCITPKEIHRQNDLSIIPLTPPARPGFNTQYKVVMTNKGNQVENGTLYFSYDEAKMDFVSTDVTPSTQSDGLLSWNFTDLLPFETRYYNVTLNVNSPGETPPVNAGDELLITCNILDNVFLLKQEVVGSYDPNDKTCLEGKTITPEQIGDYVHYLIRFENTGNYAAENVVVKDVIDESTFDISTLQITDASHEAWARINGNVVEFIFENIQLPFEDASNDGYICFKIKTKPTLVLGNELKNEANIYFDYNLPILTNKTNTVVANLVATDEVTGKSSIEVFPNPVSEVLKFSGDEKILKVEIFDMSGRLVQVSNVVDGEVNVEGLLSGAYVLKMFTTNGVNIERVLIK